MASGEPLSFAALDWFEITGHGMVAAVQYNDSRDPAHLIGEQVLIDGKLYEVRGIERHAIQFRHVRLPIHIGLAVRLAEDERLPWDEAWNETEIGRSGAEPPNTGHRSRSASSCPGTRPCGGTRVTRCYCSMGTAPLLGILKPF